MIEQPPAPREAQTAPSRRGWPDLARQTASRLRTDPAARLAVAICLIVNLVAISAWLWSRGGQATEITVGARGDNVAVAVDGQIQAFRPFPSDASSGAPPEGGPPGGGVMLMLADTGDVPGMPSPRGIDRVRVTGPDGAVLFEDTFDDLNAAWTVVEGRPIVEDGILGADGRLVLALEDRDWSDLSVEASMHNVRDMAIAVRTGEDGRGIVTRLRPTWWNQDDSKTLSIARGEIDVAARGVEVELSETETAQALVASLLRPYPYLLLLSVAALAGVVALAAAAPALVRTDDLRDTLAPLRDAPSWFWPALVGIVALLITLYFNSNGREHMPYVPDSIAYLFQAKILASGSFSADPPPVREAFEFFDPSPIVITGDHWAAQYPFGHPMMLAIGQVFGAPWIIPPILAGASVFMLGLAARNLYNMRVAIIAAVLLASSPFFIMQASNLMSHNTAIFFLIGSLLALTLVDRKPIDARRAIAYGALAGVLYGLFMNTRPLTAAALAAPFALYLLWRLIPRDDRRTWALHVAAFLGGGLLMLGAYALYNWGTTGDPLYSGYQATGVSFFEPSPPTTTPDGDAPSVDVGEAIGAGGDHRFTLGLQNERIQMALLTMALHGWPVWIGLAFVLLPFLLGSRKLTDWWLLACAVSIMAVWVLYEGDGVMWGPRYWFEAVPFLLLLAARGADRAASLLAAAAAVLRTRDAEGTRPPLWAGRAVVFSIVGVLVAYSAWSWLLGANPTWRADFVPSTASDMPAYLGIDDRIPRLVEQQDVHDALVLVQQCNNFNCYGSVFWRNDPSLDGDIVYARDLPDRRDEIIAAFPDRDVYLADYANNTLRPYTPQ